MSGLHQGIGGSGRPPPVAGRPTLGVASLLHVCFAFLSHLTTTHAAPLASIHADQDEPIPPSDPGLWLYLTIAITLVLLGGAFAGLTIALMGQDEIYLQVLSASGDGSERKNAAKVLGLLKKGKHWVLVTLLVANVITNETLPIVLDRSIGGGYAAAAASTLLVIVFGEIVPQSICVRYGLSIGAWMANFVLILMWMFSPVTWPIAKLLDYLLGEDHGTVYKKSGLKTLVTLHKSLGGDGDRLNADEVSIISGVLDLKAKSVGSIMTPMNDVFVLPSNAVLDADMMEAVMREGYSRIPIHEPHNKSDFVGMLLVKMLITYDPDDALKVSDFSLATLPETRPETSCLDIINFFQKGKSHMVLVSDDPGAPHGALGVVTLEDVIEELIGEEIIDESDVFIDVHKAIRRMHPPPITRIRAEKGEVITDPDGQQDGDEDDFYDHHHHHRSRVPQSGMRSARPSLTASESGRSVTFPKRRESGHSNHGDRLVPVNVSKYSAEMRQQLGKLGPSNAARQPKPNKIGSVTIKAPAVSSIPENKKIATQEPSRSNTIPAPVVSPEPTAAQEGVGAGLITPGLDASDGVQALQQGYGTWGNVGEAQGPRDIERESVLSPGSRHRTNPLKSPPDPKRTNSTSTIGSMHTNIGGDRPILRNRGAARSGSIHENFAESGKLVLETTSSSDEENHVRAPQSAAQDDDDEGGRAAPGEVVEGSDSRAEGTGRKRKQRPRRRKKKPWKENGKADGNNEQTPLLQRNGQ
ncbi:hypothetical protein FH972_023420 [Carpinus fangiana]|uniref:CNNM transmembrane domain-containing protein n=1 Tax=Carpinus fangiana TaxID=176857 RepID=A0A5N6KVR7_9ROSI|nr:hypothetical protein FH972_023420 [Carpinus fangiana]